MTEPVTVVIPDSAAELGRIGTLAVSRQPLMTHGKVNPRKCAKSSSTMVMSRSPSGTCD